MGRTHVVPHGTQGRGGHTHEGGGGVESSRHVYCQVDEGVVCTITRFC